MARMLDTAKVDRTEIRSYASFEDAEKHERELWWSRSAEERWNAAEMMRQSLFAYDPDTARIPRPIEAVERRAS